MVEFKKHTSFPLSKCFFTDTSKMLWKMQVREWAWALVDLHDVADTVGVDSNNPNPVPGRFAQGGKAITATRVGGTQKKEVKLFAEQAGFTLVFAFDGADTNKVGNNLQIEVLTRRAPNEAGVSLTSLQGKTIAFNAPDAISYEGDTTHTFNKDSFNPAGLFSAVQKDTNHVMISSHGGVPNERDKNDVKKLSIFACGFNLTSLRLDLSNVEDAFKPLKDKVAENAVVWIGGCTIGENNEFCQKAANASGCHVVAPARVLIAKKYPKNNVDVLDRFCMPKVFKPGDANPIKMGDFCAKQETHKFVVPV